MDDMAYSEAAVSCKWINHFSETLNIFDEYSEKTDLLLTIVDTKSYDYETSDLGRRTYENIFFESIQTFEKQRELVEKYLLPHENVYFYEIQVIVSFLLILIISPSTDRDK